MLAAGYAAPADAQNAEEGVQEIGERLQTDSEIGILVQKCKEETLIN